MDMSLQENHACLAHMRLRKFVIYKVYFKIKTHPYSFSFEKVLKRVFLKPNKNYKDKISQNLGNAELELLCFSNFIL